MSEEQKRLIEETVENLKHLDKESLLVVRKVNVALNCRTSSCHVIDCKVDSYDCKYAEKEIIQNRKSFFVFHKTNSPDFI